MKLALSLSDVSTETFHRCRIALLRQRDDISSLNSLSLIQIEVHDLCNSCKRNKSRSAIILFTPLGKHEVARGVSQEYTYLARS